MKFEMTGSEFSEFCAQLSKGGAEFKRVQELEDQAIELRAELESVREERSYFQDRNERLINENNELTYTQTQVSHEVRSLKSLVKDLQDQLTPNRKERTLSRAFAFYRDGKKIPAIKEVRTALELGLKEAKDIVEGNHPNLTDPALITLARIFACYHDTNVESHVSDQRERLYSVVGNVVTTAEADLILAGKFHPAEEPISF